MFFAPNWRFAIKIMHLFGMQTYFMVEGNVGCVFYLGMAFLTEEYIYSGISIDMSS
jgi:hypothetical protein